MSDYKAIAATTNKLKDLLETNLASKNVEVTLEHPIDVDVAKSQLNLYLYHLTENRHYSIYHSAGLWLELNYLLTPYNKSELRALTLLGDAMRVLDEHPVMTLDGRAKARAEKLKILPVFMDVEDLVKIWKGLRQEYRLSVVYQVGVIHIATEETIPVSKTEIEPDIKLTHETELKMKKR
jgi:hypothetical protein